MNISTILNIGNETFIATLVAHGGKIILILLLSWFVARISSGVIERVIRKAVPSTAFDNPENEKKREDTLISAFASTVRVIVWLITGLMILTEVGVNVAPMLAAAGVAGLAFSFGGQYLIKDVISGLLILFEDQYHVGDVICVSGTCGLVENMNLRLTTLRDLDGVVHHVSNGEIKVASNLTKGFARVNLTIGIGYGSDIEKVEALVNKVGAELAMDPKWKNDIIKAPVFVRIEEFADSAIVIRVLGDTKAMRQWDVAGELRKRLKIAFDHARIEIPFPQRVIHTT